MSHPYDDYDANPLAALQRRASRGLIIQGVLALLTGAVMFLWPGASLQVFAWLVGAWLIINGILGMASWLRARAAGRGGTMLLAGLLSLILGIIIMLLPETAVLALVAFIAFWAFLLGVLQIFGSLIFRRMGLRSWWVMLMSGIAGLAIGLVFVFNPAAGAVSLLWLVAGFMLLVGAVAIVLAVRVGRATLPTPAAGFGPAGFNRGGGFGTGGPVVQSDTVDRDDEDREDPEDPPQLR